MHEDILCKIKDLRHELHRYPELSMEEKDTIRMLRRFLMENTSLRIVDCGNWFYAVKEGIQSKVSEGNAPRGKAPGGKASEGEPQYRERPDKSVLCDKKADDPLRKRIAFRADMDALPVTEDTSLPYHSLNAGTAHKCGHDGHCAALCGLAMELDRTGTVPDVYMIFQPGEETGQGALLCRDLIKKEQISEIFAFHNLSGYPEGSLVYRPGLTQPSSEGLRIRFHGKTSHASEPEKGLNPAEAVAKAVLQTQKLAEEKTNGMLLSTITGISLGSGDFGISPGEAELSMTLRAEIEAEMKELEQNVLAFTREISEKAGLRMEFSIHDYFPETRNHETSLRKVLKAAEDLGIPAISMEKLWRASEDFGWYLKECPGAMFYIGNGEKYPALHTEEYDFNDRILETVVDLLLRLALQEPHQR